LLSIRFSGERLSIAALPIRFSWLVDTKLGTPGFFRERFAIALGNRNRGDWKKMKEDKNIMKKVDEEIKAFSKKYGKI